MQNSYQLLLVMHRLWLRVSNSGSSGRIQPAFVCLESVESRQILLAMDWLGIYFEQSSAKSSCWLWIGTGSMCINFASNSESSGQIQSAFVCYGSARSCLSMRIKQKKKPCRILESKQLPLAMDWLGIKGYYPSESRIQRGLAGYGSTRSPYVHRLCIGFGIVWSNPIRTYSLWIGWGFLIHQDRAQKSKSDRRIRVVCINGWHRRIKFIQMIDLSGPACHINQN
ncbi:hypothetical protein PGTUg99_001059 [Puccinia graminis f. sp. tritici]|uniref:Uncharacterized protein n=1 Tax=Puccinia graminis f. sp. tritici TaxID=56615 RepID=A0A5B0RZ65_PUCGR|nr:hypothetical protein PGTUg99_036323 [Puccinia graminis f. sp. tritici]KAA1130469.1 hypothetical protein PGTUg99_001059 [Puccinia graminis f. sp. tritici]